MHMTAERAIFILRLKTGGSVRKRVRGKMAAVRMPETDMLKRLINYLKFIAELDINEHKIRKAAGLVFTSVNCCAISVSVHFR